jgi:double zinc ribbon protein
MNCQSCGYQNRDGVRFCEECGAALARRCTACGTDVPPAAKFCGACGASLEQFRNSKLEMRNAGEPSRTDHAADKAEARKVVTIVFADLIGSMSLHERLDAESVWRSRPKG